MLILDNLVSHFPYQCQNLSKLHKFLDPVIYIWKEISVWYCILHKSQLWLINLQIILFLPNLIIFFLKIPWLLIICFFYKYIVLE